MPGVRTFTGWLAALAFAAGFVGCGEEGATKPSFDATELVANVADNIVIPAVIELDDKTKALYKATNAWCKAAGTATEDAERAKARVAWRAVMAVWQRVELMKFGPLAVSDGAAARDDIYSWPTVSACAVDQGVAKLRLEPDFPIKDALANWRGLDAMEYLLWAPNLDSQCPEMAKPPNWETLPKPDRAKARCNYAALVALDLGGRTAVLKDSWAVSSGNYLGKFKRFGSGGVFDSPQAAENAISDGFFYLDKYTKDRKLGAPAGKFENACGTRDVGCAKAAESPWAHAGKAHLQANLDAFSALFNGKEAATGKGTGVGFVTHLESAGHNKLADAINADITAAKAAVDAIPVSVFDAATNGRDKLVTAHTAIKKIVDILKADFLLAISLDLPSEAAGDAD